MTDHPNALVLERIANALERLAPPPPPASDFTAAEGFIWMAETCAFQPVPDISRVPLALLKGVDHMRDALVENTERFARGLPANNALLWGARGMGKSSLVKAVHAAVSQTIIPGRSEGQTHEFSSPNWIAGSNPAMTTYLKTVQTPISALKLVEIHREDIATLPACLAHLRAASGFRFILLCDDLSFDAGDSTYKSLKTVLDGGIEGRPENVLFYATSNRRHLLPRDMMDNERATAINPGEAVEEKVSLSDRFGLWIGFHNCSQNDYLEMVRGYAAHFGLKLPPAQLDAEALAWSMGRGARSGRVAWQFIQDAAGREGVRIT
ncbi:MAG: ATP-binding protein [Chitinophagales bacterium]|nr:ATP-binding protein [Hyphomicrobiales bacterium]